MLSINGGIISALVLDAIEKRTDVRAAKNFDLIAGTLTGGVLALGLSEECGGGEQERYTAQKLAKIYECRGKDIFN